MLYAGIDWADDHHDVYIMDPEGKKVACFQIKHSAEGFGELLNRVSKLGVGKEDILFAIERSNGLLVDYLLSHGFKVYPVPPQSMSSYRKRHVTSGAKCDIGDAMVLADALRTDVHRFKPLVPDSDMARELKMLVQDREALVKHQTRLSNQLTVCLKEYYPALFQVFSDVASPSSLEFIIRYPTMGHARRMSLKEFKRFLKEVNYPAHLSKKSPQEKYQDLMSQQLPVDPVVVKAKSRLALVLAEQLKALKAQIARYNEEIDELFNQHPDCGLFSSLPAAGDILAPKLSSMFCENRERFESYRGIQCLSGTAPVTESSGKYKRVSMRYACNKLFRHTMHQFAFCSINKCLWAKRYYEGKRESGHTHTAALRALANKWLKIIYTMWKNHAPYNEALFLAARQQHALVNAA